MPKSDRQFSVFDLLLPAVLFLLLFALGSWVLLTWRSYADERPEGHYESLRYTVRLQNCPLGLADLISEGCELTDTSSGTSLGVVAAVESVYPTPRQIFSHEEQRYLVQPLTHSEDINLVLDASGAVMDEYVQLAGDLDIRVGSAVYARIQTGGMASGIVTHIWREGVASTGALPPFEAPEEEAAA